MSLVNMSGVNFDSKIFLNQVNNNTIPKTTENLNEEDKVNFDEVIKNTINKVNNVQVKANEDLL